jgi:hypothetical protein
MKERAEEFEINGIDIESIRTMATKALGKIGNTNIRKWLVEIECI